MGAEAVASVFVFCDRHRRRWPVATFDRLGRESDQAEPYMRALAGETYREDQGGAERWPAIVWAERYPVPPAYRDAVRRRAEGRPTPDDPQAREMEALAGPMRVNGEEVYAFGYDGWTWDELLPYLWPLADAPPPPPGASADYPFWHAQGVNADQWGVRLECSRCAGQRQAGARRSHPVLTASFRRLYALLDRVSEAGGTEVPLHALVRLNGHQ